MLSMMPASPTSDGHNPFRPQTPHMSKSFSRLESPRSSPLSRSRASTLQNGATPEDLTSGMTVSPLSETINTGLQQDDIFEKNNLVSGDRGSVQDVDEPDSPREVPEGFDELPIELISLVDR